jgi:hypothetical protein
MPRRIRYKVDLAWMGPRRATFVHATTDWAGTVCKADVQRVAIAACFFINPQTG